ncbi:radical SAM protein [Carnobacteriaceae bacterium zg-84]|uniref:radical SAM protein n=1 Tax=Granulicatella sp. zg-84 TaxID=2678503 RepID=UPI0013C155B2|nr:radical SAM protein [Granulicatella sp. zg-84]NEW65821.1 4Fe-4S cluster-binding domain-containing protein [Granulicatella sp. zg-84]QMI86325.1 radical SAM protein [Carnobacteriaceae bacterium zg-84]
MELSPYILRKKVENGELYFNSKNNHSFFMTNDLLKRIDENKIKQQFNQYLKIHNYFKDSDEFENSILKIRQYEDKTLEFTILVHGDCNFRCKYCYEKFENISMSKETEKRILEFAKERLLEKRIENFHVAWFGGEPLLGFKTIKRLSVAFKSLSNEMNVKYSASITTNGYLLNERIFNQLVKEYDVRSFQITIDGEEENHNFQRALKNGSGSYQKIMKHLRKMVDSPLSFSCACRFNISQENIHSIKRFLDGDGKIFKNDKRFKFYFYNVGNWGCGDRPKNYKVTLAHKDASFELSKLAISKGYNVPISRSVITNLFNCYANRPNHYSFNVKGIIQSCTVALYSRQNIFGTVHGKFNVQKFNEWRLTIDDECQKCPVVLICKSGYCPPAHRVNKNTRLCEQIKRKIDKNLELFVLNKEYNDYLDVERKGVK